MSGWTVSRRVKNRKVYAHYIWADQSEAQYFADSLNSPTEVEVNVSSDRPYKAVPSAP
jgi:hypothetical protein